jgi:hypothetical protein
MKHGCLHTLYCSQHICPVEVLIPSSEGYPAGSTRGSASAGLMWSSCANHASSLRYPASLCCRLQQRMSSSPLMRLGRRLPQHRRHGRDVARTRQIWWLVVVNRTVAPEPAVVGRGGSSTRSTCHTDSQTPCSVALSNASAAACTCEQPAKHLGRAAWYRARRKTLRYFVIQLNSQISSRYLEHCRLRCERPDALHSRTDRLYGT